MSLQESWGVHPQWIVLLIIIVRRFAGFSLEFGILDVAG